MKPIDLLNLLIAKYNNLVGDEQDERIILTMGFDKRSDSGHTYIKAWVDLKSVNESIKFRIVRDGYDYEEPLINQAAANILVGMTYYGLKNYGQSL